MTHWTSNMHHIVASVIALEQYLPNIVDSKKLPVKHPAFQAFLLEFWI